MSSARAMLHDEAWGLAAKHYDTGSLRPLLYIPASMVPIVLGEPYAPVSAMSALEWHAHHLDRRELHDPACALCQLRPPRIL